MYALNKRMFCSVIAVRRQSPMQIELSLFAVSLYSVYQGRSLRRRLCATSSQRQRHVTTIFIISS